MGSQIECDQGRGPINVARSLYDIERGEIAGFNYASSGKYVYLHPRLSKVDYDKLMHCASDEIPDALETLLAQMTCLSDTAKKDFLAHRKIVVGLEEDPTRSFVVPRVDSVPDDSAFGPLRSEPSVPKPPLESAAKRRVYQLEQVWSDKDIASKFLISPRLMATSKRMAASGEVSTAARLLQDAMNSANVGVNAVVATGSLGMTRSRAERVISTFASGYASMSVHYDACVIGKKLYIHGDEHIDKFHVCGPLDKAWLVHDVFRMAIVDPPDIVMKLLEYELALLDIDINRNGSYAVTPVEYHTGPMRIHTQPRVSSELTIAALTTEQRVELHSLSDRVVSIKGEEGESIATSVRVTNRLALVNAHVIESEMNVFTDGNPIQRYRQIARDVWAVRDHSDVKPWELRDPVKDEMVTILHNSGSEVICSSPLKVVSITDSTIILSLAPDVGFAVSGGAVVALSDFSLLGIHSAGTTTNLLAARFGPVQWHDLIEEDSVTAISNLDDAETFGARAYERFLKRGLRRVLDTAIKSLVPVYSASQHVGMAINNGERFFTPCDATHPLRVGVNKELATFESSGKGRGHYTTDIRIPGVAIPTLVRTPNLNEKVFVVGYDSEVYLSVETTVVYVGLNGKSFVIADIPGANRPLLGGAVVAWDGAVVGQCGARSISTAVGAGFNCWPMVPRAVTSVLDPAVELSHKFPLLNLEAWPTSLLEEVFTHSSVVAYKSGAAYNAGPKPLAAIGDAAAAMCLTIRLRDLGVPHAQWAAIRGDKQGNVKLAEIAWQQGFAALIVFGPGVTTTPGSKAYADVVEAFIGAVALMESHEVLTSVCDKLGLLAGSPQSTPVIA